jgi:TRAP-type mannitol/chloroaromatic compound transport system permease large subunit
MYVVFKALLSGAIIAAASELARRSSLLGAILISLPLTSILAMLWLYRDTRDAGEVSDLSWSILWVIVPSLVFFVVLPVALQSDVSFWVAIVLACAATAISYAVWLWGARRLGFDL